MIAKLLQLSGHLLRIGSRNPRDLQHVLGVTHWAAGEITDPVADIRPIPAVNVLDICPGTQRWVLQSFPSVGASVSPMECAALAALAHLVGAKRVFEFGTYKGVSTTQLALNVAEGGMVSSFPAICSIVSLSSALTPRPLTKVHTPRLLIWSLSMARIVTSM